MSNKLFIILWDYFPNLLDTNPKIYRMISVEFKIKCYFSKLFCPISSNKFVIGANEVVIYNFLALITIDTNINQFTKVYHIFDKLQQNL